MSRNSKKRTNSNLSEESISNPPSITGSYNKKKKSNGIDQQPEPQPIIIINKEIKTLDDLIELGLSYEVNKKYNVNLEKLNKITP